MKYLTSIIFIFYSFTLSAQDFYINLQTGYGFATEAGQINYYLFDYSFEGITGEIVKDGLGEGVYLRGTFGYNYNDFISFDFGFNYLQGRTLIYSHKNDWFLFNGNDEYHSFQNINALIFSPQLLVRIPTKFKIKPYAKVGIAVSPFIESNLQEYTLDILTEQKSLRTERTMEGGTPLGFTTALGLNYDISDKIALLIDCNLLNMSYRPYKETITKFMVGNENLVNSLSLFERETIYVRTIEDYTIDENLPKKKLPISLPMSNISLNLGLQFNL